MKNDNKLDKYQYNTKKSNGGMKSYSCNNWVKDDKPPGMLPVNRLFDRELKKGK